MPPVSTVPPQNAPAPQSKLLQNLQSVSSQPFKDPGASTPPQSASSAPVNTAASSVTGSSVPSEVINTKPTLEPVRGRKTASAGGGGLFGLSRRVMFMLGGAVALIAVAIGGFLFWNSQSAITPSPTGTTSPTGRQVTLQYWGLWESEAVMRPLIDRYEQQNPGVNIEYTQQNSRQYRQRLQAAIAQGNGPDIFRYHNTWVPMIETDLAPAPSTIMSAETMQRDFYPVMSQDLVRNNQVLGMPLMYDGLALLYNQNMLEAAAALPPSDWQQVRELALRLAIRDGQRLQRGGIALGTADNVDHFSDILGFMMLQNSADLSNPTSPNAQSALEFYTIFSRVDQVWDSTMPPSEQAFANEQVAMIFAPSWRIHDIQALNPNLNIGVARLPQIDGTQVAWATYWVEGVSAKSRQKEEAWRFLNYLSQPEQLRSFHTTAGSLRGYGELYPRVSMASELKTNPLLAPYLDDALFAQSWYLASDTFDEGLNDGLIQYYTDAVNQINQSGSAERALQSILPGIQQVLSRYGLAAPVAQ